MPDVLVVEDNPVNTALAAAVLASQGHTVRTAQDASSMEDALQQGRPDLILMDLGLPGTDGLALTRRLKADPLTARVPVIALTAYAMPQDRARALAAGCDGYLTKPFQPQALVDAVNAALTHDAFPAEDGQ